MPAADAAMTIDTTRATQVLQDNFRLFDTASQPFPIFADNRIGVADLEAVAQNANGQFGPELVETARFLLDSQAARSFLDVGAGPAAGSVDGRISREDLAGAQKTIASGGLEAALLDTAAGRGGADGYIGGIDLQAARSDPGIPPSLNEALQTLPAGLPLQTQLRYVLAQRNLAGDVPAAFQLSQLVESDAFRGLDESRQAQVLALFGGATEVGAAARQDLLGADIDLTDSASLEAYLLTEARPADKWRDAHQPNGVPDAQRHDYSVGTPEPMEYDFPSGTEPGATETLPAWRYTVEVGGESIEVIVPQALDDANAYPSVAEIARGLAAQPPASLEATDSVVVNPVRPQEHDEKGDVVDSGADMYAGDGRIGINPHDASNPRTQSDIDFTFLHETAHLVSQPGGPGLFGLIGRAEWNAAARADGVFPTHYADDRYVDDAGNVDGSPTIDPGEDFAEAYMIYHLVVGTPDEAQMRALMPERFAILDRMS